jgi:hypothetical protein
MTRSESPDEPPEPGTEYAAVRHPSAPESGPALLVRATRLLTGLAEDADDATLMTLLGPVVVPALGDVAALYIVEPDGSVTLAGAEPAQNGLVRRLRGHLQQHPDAARITYAGLANLTQPAIVRPAGPDLPPGIDAHEAAPNRVLGLAEEIVAPLANGSANDALLAIGSADRNRQYDAADLATVEVLATLLAGRRAIRLLTLREARLRQQLAENVEAGRELAHRLNNDLTMPVGVVELLLDRGAPGSDLQEMLEAASKDLAALEQHIREFHEQMRGQSSAPAGPRPPER